MGPPVRGSALALFLTLISSVYGASFSGSGLNLAVLRVGDGVQSLTTAATVSTYVDEVSASTGTLVQSLDLTTGTGCSLLPTDTYAGHVYRANDQSAVHWAGFTGAVGTAAATVQAAGASRCIVTVDSQGNINTTTFTGAFTGTTASVRAVAALDNGSGGFWVSGAYSSTTAADGGLWYVAPGGATVTKVSQIATGSNGGHTGLALYNGNTFTATGYWYVYGVTGQPKVAATMASVGTSAPYVTRGVSFTTAGTMYVVDFGYGLRWFTGSGVTYSTAGTGTQPAVPGATVCAANCVNMLGVAALPDGTAVFVSTKDAIYKYTVSGAVWTKVISAAAGTEFRGVSLTPVYVPPPQPIAGTTPGPFQAAGASIVALRVGDGVQSTTGTSTVSVALEEYAINGTRLQAINMPSAASGSNNPCSLIPTDTYAGLLSRSMDSSTLMFGAYATAPATAATTVQSTTSVNKVICTVDYTGAVKSAVSFSGAYTGTTASIRSVHAADNGTAGFYVSGAYSATTAPDGGLWYIPTAAGVAGTPSKLAQIATGSNGGSAGIALYGGNTYVATGYWYVYAASGYPTTTATFASVGTSAPYVTRSISFTAAGTMYVVDFGYGLRWFTGSGVTYSTAGTGTQPAVPGATVCAANCVNMLGVAALPDGTAVFVSTKDAIYRFTVSTAVWTKIASAPTGTEFRGVALPPAAPASAPPLPTTPPTAFTEGNILVARVGDGVEGLTTVATSSVVLEEWNRNGTKLQSIGLPKAANNTDQACSLLGGDSYTGLLKLSGDGFRVMLAGYAAPPGTAATTILSDTPTTAKVICTALYNGNLSSYYTLDSAAFTGTTTSVRSVVSNTGVDGFWVSGAYSATTAVNGGLWWQGAAGTPATRITTSTYGSNGGLTGLALYNNFLYAGTGYWYPIAAAASTTATTFATLTSTPNVVRDVSFTPAGVMYLVDFGYGLRWFTGSGAGAFTAGTGTQPAVPASPVCTANCANMLGVDASDGATVFVSTRDAVYSFTIATATWAKVASAPLGTEYRGVSLAPRFDCFTELQQQPQYASRFANALVAASPAGSRTAYYARCNYGYYGTAVNMTCSMSPIRPIASSNSVNCTACVPPAPAAGVVLTVVDAGRANYSCAAGYTGTTVSRVCDQSTVPQSYSGVPPTCAQCGAGYYCTGGSAAPVACPAGSYGDAAALTLPTSACSGLCDAGYVCNAVANTNPRLAKCGGTGANYCPAGSITPLTCTSGYTTPTTAPVDVRSGCAACPTDRLCSGGLLAPAVDLQQSCPGGAIDATLSDDASNVDFGAYLMPRAQGWSVPYFNWTLVGVTASDPLCAPAAARLYLNTTAGGATQYFARLAIGNGTVDPFLCGNALSATVAVARQGNTNPADVATCTLNVKVTQTVRAPVFTTCANITVSERLPLNTRVTGALAAQNRNSGTTLTFVTNSSVSYPVAGRPFPFLIDCGGTLVAAASVLYQAASAYVVTARVDNIGLGSVLSAYCTFTVSVQQVFLPPRLTVTSFSLYDLSPSGTAVGNVAAVSDNFVAASAVTTALLMPNATSSPSSYDNYTGFAIDTRGNITLTSSTLDATRKSRYVLAVNVSDGYASAVVPVTVVLLPSARPPVTLDQSLTVSDTAAAGTRITPALYATHPQSLAMTFSLVDASGTFGVYPNGTVYVLVSNALNVYVRASYALTFTVTDSAGKLSSATVTIAVQESNKAPTFTFSTAEAANKAYDRAVAEGAASGATAGAAVTATDVNVRDTLVFAVVSCAPTYYLNGAQVCPFTVDALTGALKVSSLGGGILSYNSSAAYAVPYQVQMNVSVTDSGSPALSAYATVRVNITNIAPRITGATVSIKANASATTAVWNASAATWSAYPTTGNRLSYSISAPRTPAGDDPFAVSAAGAITVSNITSQANWSPRFDYNAQPTLVVTVTVTDTVTGLSASATLTVKLIHSNRAPVWSLSMPTVNVPSRSSASNLIALSAYVTDADLALSMSPPETLTFALATGASNGNTDGTFNVSAAGVLGVANSSTPSFRYNRTSGVQPQYKLVLSVCDAGVDGPQLCATTTLSVVVIEGNVAPTIAAQGFSVPENSPATTAVGAIVAYDEDIGQQLTYSIVSGNVDDVFAVNARTGALTVAKSNMLDFETRRSYALVVQVTDDGIGNLTASATVTVTVTDVNEPPAFTSATFAVSVDENADVNTTVGANLTTTDPDAQDAPRGKRTFTLVGSSPFSVDPVWGTLRVARAPSLDYETTGSYTLTARVTDSAWDGKGALTADATIIVTLNNRNDEPVVTSRLTASVAENAAATAVAGTVTVADQDVGQAMSYALKRTNLSCWAAGVSAATVNTRQLSPFAITSSGTGVVSLYSNIRGLSSDPNANATIILSVNGSNPTAERYEIQLSGSGTAVFHCVTTCPAVPLVRSSTVLITTSTAATATPMSYLRMDVDFTGSQLVLYAYPTGDFTGSPRATVVAPETSTVARVKQVLVTASVTGAAFSSVCYPSPSAAGSAAFTIDPTTGVVSTAAALDFETQSVYGLEIAVTDQPGTASLQPAYLTAYGVLLISVTDVNEAPGWSNASLSSCAGFPSGALYAGCLSIPENSGAGLSLAGSVVAAVDPDTAMAQQLAYSLGLTNNLANSAALFNITALSRVVSLAQSGLDYETRRQYELSLIVSDGSLTGSTTLAVAVTDVNEPPSLLNAVRTVPEQTVFNTAPAGASVGAPVTGTDPDTLNPTWSTLNYTIVGGDGATLFNISATTGQIAVTASGSPLLDYETKSSYSLTVRTTDGGGLSATATITVQLLDVNEPPTLLGPFLRNVSENIAGPTPVGPALVAVDPDNNQQLSYSITGGNGSSLFRIDQCSGQISLKAGFTLDYEAVQTYVVQVTVVDNGTPQLSASANVTIAVLDADDAPVVAPQTVTVPENSGANMLVAPRLTATDPDTFGGTVAWYTLTWSIIGGNAQGIFAINATTGQLSIASGGPSLLNFEDSRQNSFSLLVKAADGGGQSTTAVITVTVTDVNEAPAFTDPTLARAVDETTPRSPHALGDAVGAPIAAADPDAGQTVTLTYAITAGDALGYFSVSTTGTGAAQLKLTAAGAAGLDFETVSSYNLTLRVTDTGGLNATAVVAVTVNNRNEAPVFAAAFTSPNTASFARSVAENATLGTAVGAVLPAADAEDRLGLGLSFAITAGNAAGVFAVSNQGQIYIANTASLNYEAVQSYTLTVSLTDTGAPEGATAALTTTTSVTVTIIDVNEPPSLAAGALTLPENSVAGFVVGTVATLAADPDVLTAAFQIKNFSIVRQDTTVASVTGIGGESPFAIDATGRITVAAIGSRAANLDYESKSLYALTIRVTDGGGFTADASCTITVTNVNEAPVWQAVPVLYARALELQTVGQALASYVRDQDTAVPTTGESLSFGFGTPSGNTNNTFAVAPSDGQLSVVNNDTLVYPPGGPGPLYQLTVRVADAGINGSVLTASTVVTVIVTDANHPPTFPVSGYTFYIPENTAVATEVGRAYATDRDFATQTVNYTLSAAGANINRPFPFTIDTAVGAGTNNIGAGVLKVVWDGVAGSLPWSLLDFEAPRKAAAAGSSVPGFATYSMVVTATDSHLTRLSGSVPVTIIVTDVAEAPYFAPSRVPAAGVFTLTVAENAAQGAQVVVVPAASSNAGTAAGGVLAMDDDLFDGAGNLTYAFAAGYPASSLFTLDARTGIVNVSAAGAVAGALDFETPAKRNQTVKITVTDSTGRTDTATVFIVLGDVNEPAVWNGTGILTAAARSQATSLSIPENSPAGTLIGYASATDVDAGAAGTVVYSLVVDADAQPFAINPATGAITVSSPTLLDWEDKPDWSPTVRVTDASGSPRTVTLVVPIQLTDVNDATIDGFRLAPGEEAAGRGVNVPTSAYATDYASMAVLFATPGGARVILTGTNLGFTARRLAAESLTASPTTITAVYSVFYTASSCAIVTPGREIACTVTEGFGLDHRWRVSLTTTAPRAVAAACDSTAKTGYLPPTLSVVTVSGVAASNAAGNSVPTDGGSVLAISGTNLGPASAPLVLSYGPPAAPATYVVNCASQAAHTAVTCIMAPGVGAPLVFALRVGSSTQSTSGLFTSSLLRYAAPVINAVYAPALNTAGGDAIRIVGDNFGPSDTAGIVASYAGLNANCVGSTTRPHHEVVCTSVPGIGFGFAVALTVGGQTSAGSTDLLSYRAPVLLSISGPGADRAVTEGGQTVIITGSQFGAATPADASGALLPGAVPPLVRYGHATAATPFASLSFAGVNCRVVVPHTTIQCVTAPGYGKGLLWAVSVGGQSSGVYLNQSTNYAPPVLSAFDGAGAHLAATAGAQLVYITGRNLGDSSAPIDAVTYSVGNSSTLRFNASGCVHSIPHTQLVCYTAPGVGAGLSWLAVIDGQESTTPSTDYSPPGITAISGAGAVDASTDGGDVVVLTGHDFGPSNTFLQSVTYGASGTEYVAANCSVSAAHTEITCYTVPGTGRALRWIVTTGGQSSSPSDITTSYAAPTVDTVQPANGPTEGGTTITLVGSNWGLLARSAKLQLLVNAQGVPAPSAAVLAAHYTDVYAGGAGSPAVTQWLALLVQPVITSKRIAGPRNHTLTFLLPEGYGPARHLLLLVDGVPSPLRSITYDPPRIDNVAPDRFGVEARYLRLFVEGANFCASSACGTLAINGVPVVFQGNWSHGTLVLKVDDTGDEQLVTVTVAGITSNAKSFSSPVPSFGSLTEQQVYKDMATRGGQPLSINKVTGVATMDASLIRVLVGTNDCTGVNKSIDGDLAADNGIAADSPLAIQYKTFRLDCTTPPGVGKDLPIVIVVPGGQSRADAGFRFSYAPPTVTGVVDVTDAVTSYLLPAPGVPAAAAIPTLGGALLVRGSNFGTAALGAGSVLWIVGESTSLLPVTNHTHESFIVAIPPGQGGNIAVDFIVGGQHNIDPLGGRAQPAALVRYREPTVTDVAPQGQATTGGVMLTLLGSDFGTADAGASELAGLPVILVGDLPCALPPSYRHDSGHSLLRCVLPEGQGKDLPVTVTVAGQINALTAAATYTYARPVVTALAPLSGPTSGLDAAGAPIVMTLNGTNLGKGGIAGCGPGGAGCRIEFRPTDAADASLPVFIVPFANVLSWSHTGIVFFMPEGAGRSLSVHVVTMGQASDANPGAATFAYDPPAVTALARADMQAIECRDRVMFIQSGNVTVNRTRPADCYGTAGGYPLRISGTSFGSLKPRVTLGGRVCEVLTWSHSELVITVPPGVGDYNPVVVTVGGRRSPVTASSIFAFDPPQVTSIMPNTPDAAGGALISFRGYNFGGEATPTSIVIGGIPTLDPTWMNSGLLQATVQADTVGAKNVSLLVANRSQPFVYLAEERMIVLLCKRGYTGLTGELCVACGTDLRGASCPGEELDYDLAVALAGWWRTNTSDKSLCHPYQRGRPLCPSYLPCEPASSCLGANKCSDGYTGERCAQCLSGRYYRVNGECVKCPDSPAAVVIVFVLLALGALGVAYLLNKHQVNLALISIGIDYMQIVAMFARTRIRWPALVKELFLIMSAFNFNLELIAPECAIPEVTFSGKWLAVEALPIFGWGMLALFGFLRFAYKRLCTTKRKARLWSHLPVLASTAIVVLRVLYIYITRTTLDVFNCAPTDPPDGHEYMARNLNIICYEPGGTHLFLLPFAVAALIVYVAGAPLLALWHLHKNKEAVKTDQILRAQAVGDDRLTNPNYAFRRMWSKLYAHFSPGKWYWELVVTARKFLIAFVSLMFRNTPSYQLATALLVLFAAYVLHMRHLPYLSPATAATVVAEHRRKAMEGDKLHARIAAHLRDIEKANHRGGAGGASAARRGLDVSKEAGKAHTAGQRVLRAQSLASTYALFRLIDPNTVEGVMLASCILINLAGIMFGSARFEGDLAKFYTNEYDSLAYATIALIFCSFIYWLLCLAVDLSTLCCPGAMGRGCSKVSAGGKGLRARGAAALRRKAAGAAGADKPAAAARAAPAEAASTQVEMQSNPILVQRLNAAMGGGAGKRGRLGLDTDDILRMEHAPDDATWRVIQKAFADLQEKVQAQARQMEMDREAVASGAAAAATAGGTGPARAAPRVKQSFEPVSSSSSPGPASAAGGGAGGRVSASSHGLLSFRAIGGGPARPQSAASASAPSAGGSAASGIRRRVAAQDSGSDEFTVTNPAGLARAATAAAAAPVDGTPPGTPTLTATASTTTTTTTS